MNINNGLGSGESSYRTTIPTPEAITFSKPDVMQHVQDDDDSDTKSVFMIEPCRNFGDYSSWMKRNFSHLVHKKDIEFMDHVLELYDQEKIFELYYYQPKQWVDFLGKQTYLKHYKFLIELNLVWTATIHKKDPIDWETYHEIRDDNHANVSAAYKREANILLDSDFMASLPARTSSVVPVKTPVVTSPMDLPPAYTKVSPVVKASSIAKAPKAASKRKQGSFRS